MSEHTRGPWSVGYDGPSRPIIITGEPGTMLAIGRLDGGTAHTYVNEDADARLIASAPVMLEALRDMLGSYERVDEYGRPFDLPWGTVRAALAAAEGVKAEA